jgi:Fe-S-cluster containining protein
MPEILGNFEDLEFSDLQKDFVSFAVQNYTQQLDANNDPIKEKVGAMYNVIDEINQETLYKEGEQHPSCFKGCAHCCHIMVACTEWEAITALEYMNHIGLKFEKEDIQKLESQASVKLDSDYMVHPDRRCVFLGKDNLCQIYEARPSACRNYFVFSPPDECDTFKQVGAGKVLTNFNLDTIAPIITLMEKSSLASFPSHIVNLLKTEKYKTNVLRDSENAGPGDTPECQLHTGEQSKE